MILWETITVEVGTFPTWMLTFDGGKTIVASAAGQPQVTRSFDGGKTWSNLVTYSDGVIPWTAINLWDSDIILTGTGFGNRIDRSEDRGETWEEVYDYAVFNFYNRVLFQMTEDIVIGVSLKSIVKSNDRGLNWSQVKDLTGDPGSPEAFSGCRISDTVALIGTSGGKIYRTVNGGDTWAVFGDMSAIGTTPKELVTNDGQTIYAAATNNKIVKSEDGGETWELIRTCDRGAEWYYGSLTLWPSGELWVTDDDEIVSTVDGGDTWTVIVTLGDLGYIDGELFYTMYRVSGKEALIGVWGNNDDKSIVRFYDNTYDEVKTASPTEGHGTVNEGFGGFGFGGLGW